MKAIVSREYGSTDVLRLEQVEAPSPKDNEVLIRVYAAEVTKADCELRSFNFSVKWFWLPLRLAMGLTKPKRQILGGYFSGEIEAVGADVSRFKKGDQVFGAAQLRMGAYGEYIFLPAGYTIVEKPDNMSFEEAAAVPLGGLNALHFLRMAKVRKGESVLVNGAGGSIGTFAVQIAKDLGAEVTAVDSAIKEEMLRRIGADHFFDYAKEDFTTTGEKYHVIFDMVARSPYGGCVAALNAGGRYLMANPRVSDMLRSVCSFFVRLLGQDSTVSVSVRNLVVKDELMMASRSSRIEGGSSSMAERVFGFTALAGNGYAQRIRAAFDEVRRRRHLEALDQSPALASLAQSLDRAWAAVHRSGSEKPERFFLNEAALTMCRFAGLELPGADPVAGGLPRPLDILGAGDLADVPGPLIA